MSSYFHVTQHLGPLFAQTSSREGQATCGYLCVFFVRVWFCLHALCICAILLQSVDAAGQGVSHHCMLLTLTRKLLKKSCHGSISGCIIIRYEMFFFLVITLCCTALTLFLMLCEWKSNLEANVNYIFACNNWNAQTDIVKRSRWRCVKATERKMIFPPGPQVCLFD